MSWLGSWGESWGPILVDDEPKTYYGSGRYAHKRNDDLTAEHVIEVYDLLASIKARPSAPAHAHAQEILASADRQQEPMRHEGSADTVITEKQASEKRASRFRVAQSLLFAVLSDE